MKILVPTDFSENAKNAFEFAKKIALQEKATITLFYAFYAVYDFAAQATEILGQIEEEAKRELKKAVKEGIAEGLDMDYRIVQGTVASAVTSIAYREDYDLVVMGTQGASGIKKALLGSNTGHVIKESKTAVLAIPEAAKLDKVKKISIGLELQKEEEKYFKSLFNLTEKLGLPYEFFHIQKENNFEKSVEFKGIQGYLKENYPHLKFEFKLLSNEETEKGLKLYLDENEDAMMVMFYKGKSFFEYLFNKSESLKMAYHTHVPLLIIK
ncbi:MAG: universal stress protein [Cecembia sp.]